MSSKTPGQVAYEAYNCGKHVLHWDHISAKDAWEAAARAVQEQQAQKLATSEAILSRIGSLLDSAGVPDGGGLETRVRQLIERKSK